MGILGILGHQKIALLMQLQEVFKLLTNKMAAL